MRPPWCGSSPCSAPSRCLLKWGRGRPGLKSELSMLTGASMMQALVTGPGGGVGEVVRTTLSQAVPSMRQALSPSSALPGVGEWWLWPRPPLRVTVLRHCWLCTSQRRTVSSWEPDRSTLPSVDTDRQVTWFLMMNASARMLGLGAGQQQDQARICAPGQQPPSNSCPCLVPAPVPSEHLPVLLLRLEALLSLPGLQMQEGR